MTGPKKLKESMKQKMVAIPYVMNAFHAKIVRLVGFEAVYMTGWGVAAERGYPDVGLITQTEMVQNAKYIVNAVDIPVICDADTGYGNPINVWRTVREYEDIGVSAIHIEDQAFPKKCGFFEGKKIITCEDHVQKIRAAIDARRDKDFIIIARCDALAVNGWKDTIKRCRAYHEAGADMVFVDGINTMEDMRVYAKELQDLPRLFNYELRFPASIDEVAKMGFKIMVVSATVLAFFAAIKRVLEELKEKGMVSLNLASGSQEMDNVLGLPDIYEEINNMLGLPDIYKMEKYYSSIT